uniref:Uncharacterized protein n=1 Tax=uncultured marine virus TaxID=186617 RepID=A0A0F7L3X2_9VIRU|nr:hypothetical protein [uncultured marine virus]
MRNDSIFPDVPTPELFCTIGIFIPRFIFRTCFFSFRSRSSGSFEYTNDGELASQIASAAVAFVIVVSKFAKSII